MMSASPSKRARCAMACIFCNDGCIMCGACLAKGKQTGLAALITH